VKKTLPALTAVFVLCASWSATAAPTQALAPKQLLRPIDDVGDPPAPARPFRGSAVQVPALISMNDAGPAEPAKVLLLPVQAAKVSRMVTTNLLANSQSWIAKGNKYYSLCRPDAGKVACAPIVATATMKDIEVGAYADEKNEPKLLFRIDPATTQDSKRLIASIRFFLARTGMQVAHFDREPSKPAPARTGTPLTGGNITPTLIEAGGGGCSWDDWGGFDCSGGDSGWDGGGYKDTGSDWESEYWGDEDSWEVPGSPEVPSFPTGYDNGDGDPCIDSSGNNICQQVIITGERPEPPQETSLPNCVATPLWVGCGGGRPPPVIDPFEPRLPTGPTPWLPQSACNLLPILCSEGQVPEVKRPPLTDYEKIQALRQQCYDEVNAEMTYCRAMAGEVRDPNNTCMRNAIDRLKECDKIGQDGY
jgi:hypothetical protein